MSIYKQHNVTFLLVCFINSNTFKLYVASHSAPSYFIVSLSYLIIIHFLLLWRGSQNDVVTSPLLHHQLVQSFLNITASQEV